LDLGWEGFAVGDRVRQSAGKEDEREEGRKVGVKKEMN